MVVRKWYAPLAVDHFGSVWSLEPTVHRVGPPQVWISYFRDIPAGVQMWSRLSIAVSDCKWCRVYVYALSHDECIMATHNNSWQRATDPVSDRKKTFYSSVIRLSQCQKIYSQATVYRWSANTAVVCKTLACHEATVASALGADNEMPGSGVDNLNWWRVVDEESH